MRDKAICHGNRCIANILLISDGLSYYPVCYKHMRRIILHAPILLVTLAVGILFAPYDANSGLRGLLNWLARAPFAPTVKYMAPAEFYGRWEGSGQPVIDFRDGYITDIEMGKSYAYHVVQRFNYPKGDKAVLIEVYGLGRNSNLRKFVYLGLNGNRLDYFGYDSWKSYNEGHATVVVTMSRSF